MKVEVVADSQTFSGDRLTTLEVELPTAMYPELLSYRMLSVSKRPPPPLFVDWVELQMYGTPPDGLFDHARKFPIEAQVLMLAPYSYCHAIVSATEWDSFHRGASFAEPFIQAMIASKPRLVRDSEWHLPYVDFQNPASPNFVPFDQRDKALYTSIDRLSRSRGVHDQLVRARAFTWFEHAAQAIGKSQRVGNFVGWKQYRKLFRDEWTGKSIEYNPAVDSGWAPFYLRMEAAFRELLTGLRSLKIERGSYSPEILRAMQEFFPKDLNQGDRDYLSRLMEEEREDDADERHKNDP